MRRVSGQVPAEHRYPRMAQEGPCRALRADAPRPSRRLYPPSRTPQKRIAHACPEPIEGSLRGNLTVPSFQRRLKSTPRLPFSWMLTYGGRIKGKYKQVKQKE